MTERIQKLVAQAIITIPASEGSHTYFDKEKFAELLIQECVACCGSQADKKNILKRFGLPVPSDVKYAGMDPIGHETQYTRKPNLPQ